MRTILVFILFNLVALNSQAVSEGTYNCKLTGFDLNFEVQITGDNFISYSNILNEAGDDGLNAKTVSVYSIDPVGSPLKTRRLNKDDEMDYKVLDQYRMTRKDDKTLLFETVSIYDSPQGVMAENGSTLISELPSGIVTIRSKITQGFDKGYSASAVCRKK